LIYLGTFGLEDPMSDEVRNSVDYIAHGHPSMKYNIKEDNKKNKNVSIRLISGDHVNTAIAVAL